MAKEYVVKVKADTKEFDSSIQKVDKGVQGVESSTEQATEAIDKFTNGAASAFSAGVSGARKMVAGMKTLKGAIAATGVGLLVVALGTLVQWFSTSEKGAKAFATIGYSLEALFKNLTDRLNTFLEGDLVSFFEDPQTAIKDLGKLILDNIIKRFEGILLLTPRLGEALVMLFKGDFEGAAKLAGNAILQISTGMEDTIGVIEDGIETIKDIAEEVVEETKKAISQGDRLASLENRLAKATAAFTVEQAKLTTAIDEQQKIIDDTTRSYDDRVAALETQSELSLKLAQEIANQAALEEATIKARLALTANYKESLALQQELADAQADRIEKEAAVTIVELENAQKRREIDLEEAERKKSINQAIEDARVENIENERASIEARFKLEEERALQEFELLRATEEEKTALLTELKAKRDAELLALSEKEAQAQRDIDAKKIADAKLLQDARVSLAQNAIGAISAINEAFAGADEARAKKAFEVSKLVGIAEASVNTYQGITAALTDKLTPTPIRIAQAVAAGAIGLAQVAKIKSTSFGGSGGGSAPSISGGGTAQPSTPTTPTVDFGFLQQGANQTSVQAYVISNQVTNAQQSQQLIEDQATL